MTGINSKHRALDLFENLYNLQTTPSQDRVQLQEWFSHFMYVISTQVEKRTDLKAINEYDGDFSVTEKAIFIFTKTFASKGINNSLATLQEIYELPYFHRFLSRKDAEKKLDNQPGAALLRISSTIDNIWDIDHGPFTINYISKSTKKFKAVIIRPSEDNGCWLVGHGLDPHPTPGIQHGIKDYRSISDIFTQLSVSWLNKLVPRNAHVEDPSMYYRDLFGEAVTRRQEETATTRPLTQNTAHTTQYGPGSILQEQTTTTRPLIQNTEHTTQYGPGSILQE